jgi:hypothetical protein
LPWRLVGLADHEDMTARRPPGDALAAARARGAATAHQVIAMQAGGAGMWSGRITAHHEELYRSLLSDARTDEGRAFAEGYDREARALIASLAELEARPETELEAEAE